MSFFVSARSVESPHPVQVVDLGGSLDIRTVEDFENILWALFNRNEYRIVLNLKELTYISSAGFGVLLSVIKDVRKHQGDIKVACAGSDVRRTFDLLELPKLFDFLTSVEEAVAAFGPVPDPASAGTSSFFGFSKTRHSA